MPRLELQGLAARAANDRLTDCPADQLIDRPNARPTERLTNGSNDGLTDRPLNNGLTN